MADSFSRTTDSFSRTNPELQSPPPVSQTHPAQQPTNSNPAELANEEPATPSQNTNPPRLPIEDPLNPSFPSLPWIEEPMFTTQTAALVRNAIRKEGPDNTKLAYDPKITEFKQYCRSVFSHQGELAEIVTKEKAFGFLLYNAYRPPKNLRIELRGAMTLYSDSTVWNIMMYDFFYLQNLLM